MATQFLINKKRGTVSKLTAGEVVTSEQIIEALEAKEALMKQLAEVREAADRSQARINRVTSFIHSGRYDENYNRPGLGKVLLAVLTGKDKPSHDGIVGPAPSARWNIHFPGENV